MSTSDSVASRSDDERAFDVGRADIRVIITAIGIYWDNMWVGGRGGRPIRASRWSHRVEVEGGQNWVNRGIFDALKTGTWQDIEMEIDCGDSAAWGRAPRVGSNAARRAEDVEVVQELMRGVSVALNGRRRSTRSCTFSGDWIETHAGVTAIIAGLAEIRKDMPGLEATAVNFRFPDEGWYRTLTRWDDTSAAFRQICQTIVASGTDWIQKVQIDDQTRDNVGCWVLGDGVSYLLGKGQIRSLTHAVAAPDPARQRFYSDITAGRVWGAYSGDFHGYPEHLTLRRCPCDGPGVAYFLKVMRKNTRIKSLTLLDWSGLNRDEAHSLLSLLDEGFQDHSVVLPWCIPLTRHSK